MRKWPTVCTHEIGHSKIVRHRIIITDEIPVRKRAYRVSVSRQQFIDNEIQELLGKNIIRPSVSPWASPVVIVPKKRKWFKIVCGLSGTECKNPLGWLSYAPDPRHTGVFTWSIDIQYARFEKRILAVGNGTWQHSKDCICNSSRAIWILASSIWS